MKKITALVAAAALALSLTSCTQVKNAGPALVDCAKTDIGQIIGPGGLTLLTQVAAILMAGGQGWQTALEGLGEQAGVDALACAVQAVELVLGAQAPATGSGSGASTSESEYSGAVQRARQYHALKGWHYK